MESEHVRIGNVQELFDRVDDILEDYMSRAGISQKDALRFTLLTEEAVRFAKSVVSDESIVELWFEGDGRVSNICIQTEGNFDENKKEEFLSASTSGENSAKRTFFDEIKEAFTKPKKPTWSLAEYEAELMMKRDKDKYSTEAWDNLERSVLANLADDISVSILDKTVNMRITKDFTSTMQKVGSKKPKAVTEQILFSNEEDRIEQALQKTDACLKALNLSKKDELHVKLLCEESIAMVRQIAGDFTAMMWVEAYKGECAVKLLLSTEMDSFKKEEFINTSTNKKNSASMGLMDKISDIISTGMADFDSVMKLNQEYNGSFIDYGSMGTYMSVGNAASPDYAGGLLWSLMDYKNELSEKRDEPAGQTAWDELEKSIVASIAKDVIVGIKKHTVTMTIITDVKEEK